MSTTEITPQLFEAPEIHPPATDFWVILAYNKNPAHGNGYWKLWPNKWASKAQAEDVAQKLLSHWVWRRIVHIKI